MSQMFDVLPFVRQGYCCSQILLLLALQAQGSENPGLVRAVSGLCHGLGQSGGNCGLLTGGACVLAYFSGKGSDFEQANPMFDPLINEYATWFVEMTQKKYGGCNCPQILGEALSESVRPDMSRCGDMLAQCWEKILELCDSYSIDPTMPHDAQLLP